MCFLTENVIYSTALHTVRFALIFYHAPASLPMDTLVWLSWLPYNLFFTGRDDPRNHCLIGEDVVPRFFLFETPERQLKTTVYSNNSSKVALLFFGSGKQLGSATIGSRVVPMTDLLSPGSQHNARAFCTSDGRRFEWRKASPGEYDLYALQPAAVRIAAFRRYSKTTPVGKSTGLLQYTFSQDDLLLYSILALCLNRWIDAM
ncbi:hypothetical protein FB45DRAFT_504357 [Roridomyces roridus]|uniref:DUF6593 domain-containing protein n=1 Tax=Roridomyces roridus TaxID=1738132 RepID=A0AAD7BWB6_9AGAR|nr:hypothetical protein FB45DRAFT_504357 [Roridomyces roridus]